MNLSEEVRSGLCFSKTALGAACRVHWREQAADGEAWTGCYNSPGRGGEGPTQAVAGRMTSGGR